VSSFWLLASTNCTIYCSAQAPIWQWPALTQHEPWPARNIPTLSRSQRTAGAFALQLRGLACCCDGRKHAARLPEVAATLSPRSKSPCPIAWAVVCTTPRDEAAMNCCADRSLHRPSAATSLGCSQEQRLVQYVAWANRFYGRWPEFKKRWNR